MKDYGRDLRVADFIRDELAQIIAQQMRDPRIGMVSINDVSVSKDLSYADVYVSSWETPEAEQRESLVAVLNKAGGFFRTELSHRHRMRTTPKLRFHYDELVEKGPALESLIDSAVQQDRDRQQQTGSPEADEDG